MKQASIGRLSLLARGASPLAAMLCAAAVALGGSAQAGPSSDGASPLGSSRSPFAAPATLPYTKEYPVIGYARRMPANNAIARLQARIDRGEVKLQFRPPRGYLDSLLQALEIDPSSQTLVYSKSSLQVGSITAATPRAIYFNQSTYVGWVQGARNLELAAMDSKLGQVFYILPNRPAKAVRLQRKTQDCLACHDTYELSGGGVPRFLLMSTYVDVKGNQLTHEGQIITNDQTPLKFRWGGWYVTGQSGKQVHLGNIQVQSVYQLVHLDQVRRGNLDTLDGLFNTRPYLTDKSDIVALLVLQHQVDVQNLITRVNFEVRTALAKGSHGHSAAGPREMPQKTQEALKGYMDSLVDAMLFVGATPFTSPITGNSGFNAWFEAQGPRDRLGRSLRDLDLTTRLFKYPLSYLIYSASFDALPDYAKNYIYGRFAAILTGHDVSDTYSYLSGSDRKAILEILTATQPAFARFLAKKGTA